MNKKTAYKNALLFVQKRHAGQFRANRVPAWHHLARVSETLAHVLKETQEGSAQERFLISLAALGHDLLEDTDAKKSEIEKIFGVRGLELIKGMTNWWGDKEKPRYIRQVTRAEEAVRLVKLADLYDNITSVTYNLKILGVRWTTSYFLPIVTPMRRVIVKTKFRRYRKTAKILIFFANTAACLLDEEVKRLRKSA